MKHFTLGFFLFLSINSTAQYCTPVTTNYCCGYGITRFTFNTIDNISTDASAGYQDFTNLQTNVLIGQNYPVSVKVDVPGEHNVKAWVDWNNDQVFDDINEIVLSASQVLTVNSSIYIPANALMNTPLRLRVSADFYSEQTFNPCDSLFRGQAEDYLIMVVQNPNPPEAAFLAENTTSCNGIIQFEDKSLNLPTQWLWDFGDGSTSALQHPVHTYSSSGQYTVSLIAINNNGSDTTTIQSYISITMDNLLTPALCSPVTTANCCNYGIFSVSFNTISNTTPGGEESYQDYSCTHYTSVNKGSAYNLSVSTGSSLPEDVRVWLDYNNDGDLSENEKIFTSLNSYTHSANITIPANALTGGPFRLRIISESAGNPVNSCTEPQFGQTEDYGVSIDYFAGDENKYLAKENFWIHPNPSDGKFTLDGLKKPAVLCLYTVSGQLVFCDRVQPGQLVETGLSSGLYFLTLSGEEFSAKKITIE